MAAMEDSPSRCQGQAWMLWAQRVGVNVTNDESGDEKDAKNSREGDAMKLRKEDMPLFGSCPAQEEFYLVECEECGLVVKPQALRSHIERRHSCNNNFVANSDNNVSGKSAENSSPLAHKLGGAKDVCRTSSRNVPLATKSCDKPSLQLNRFNTSPKQPPPQQNLNLVPPNKSSAGLLGKLERHDSKSLVCGAGGGVKKNHNISPPVVKVDRMLPTLATLKKGVLSAANVTICSSTQSPSAIPADKRELPSPQQPPPTVSSSPLSPSLSSNSPASVSSSQQQQCLTSPVASSGGSSRSTQGVSGGQSSVALSSSLNKKGGNAGSTTLTLNANNNTNSSSGESKLKPSKSKKVPKERKLLPCKDRVYDPDKHCGVFVVDTGRQCTRSLTCKTHSLAMRRNVPGRRKRFDELLSDHRATKEAMVKVTKGSAGGSVTNSRTSMLHEPGKGNVNIPTASTAVGNNTNSYHKGLQVSEASKVNCSGSSSVVACNQRLPSGVSSTKSKTSNIKNHVTSSSSIQRPSSSGASNQSCGNETQRKSVDVTSSSVSQQLFNSVDKDDDGYIAHHPKPAAVCTFNSRQMGLGFYVHDRKMDSIRAVLRLALGERISQPPSVKKLCVESKLPPVPESSDPSDPYCFTFGEQTNSISSVTASASLTVPVTSCGKTPPGSTATTTTTNVSPRLKSPTILSQSFSVKSSQKLNKPCVNRSIKNKLNKDGLSANQCNVNDLLRKNTTTITTTELNKSVRPAGGATLKRKRGSSAVFSEFCDPLVNNNNNNVVNSPPYHPGGVANAPPTANLLTVPIPVAHLTTTTSSATYKGTPVTPFAIPTCASGVISRNHANTAAAGDKDYNLVVSNVELVNGQLSHGGISNSSAAAAMISRTTTSCMSANATGTVRTSLSGINLGLTAAGSPLHSAASPSYLSSGPNRASPVSSSPSQISSFTFSSAAAVAKDTKLSSTKRSKSSSASAKSVRQGHNSPNTSTTLLTPTPAKWNMVNNTAVLTGLGALSNANLLSGSLSTNNHVANSTTNTTTPDNCAVSPPHSNFSSTISIKSNISTHLSTSSPLLNGIGPTSSSSSPTASAHHRNLTNHILPANTATFTVNSDSQVGANSDCPAINSEAVQLKGRGSRPNACRSSSSVSTKHHVTLSTPSPSSGLIALGQQPTALSGNGGGVGGGKVVAPAENDSTGAIQELTNNSSQLSHFAPNPLKLLSSSLGGTVTPSKSKNQKPFGLHNAEFKRPSEIQGSSTLPT